MADTVQARVLRFMVWKARTRREDLPPTTLVEAELRNIGDMLSARLRTELSNVSPHGYELVPRVSEKSSPSPSRSIEMRCLYFVLPVRPRYQA